METLQANEGSLGLSICRLLPRTTTRQMSSTVRHKTSFDKPISSHPEYHFPSATFKPLKVMRIFTAYLGDEFKLFDIIECSTTINPV
jgi:hypothetical protein